MKIHCDCCGKFLFNSKTDSMGAAGAEAQRLGFIYNMPGVFYHTDKLSVIFCGKECCKRWFKENVSQETSEAAKPQLEAMRKRMKKAADEFPKHLDNFLGGYKARKARNPKWSQDGGCPKRPRYGNLKKGSTRNAKRETKEKCLMMLRSS